MCECECAQCAHDIRHRLVIPQERRSRELRADLCGECGAIVPDACGTQSARRGDGDDDADGRRHERPQECGAGVARCILARRHAESPPRFVVEGAHGSVARIEDGIGDRSSPTQTLARPQRAHRLPILAGADAHGVEEVPLQLPCAAADDPCEFVEGNGATGGLHGSTGRERAGQTGRHAGERRDGTDAAHPGTRQEREPDACEAGSIPGRGCAVAPIHRTVGTVSEP